MITMLIIPSLSIDVDFDFHSYLISIMLIKKNIPKSFIKFLLKRDDFLVKGEGTSY